ncbi:MAG TPA: DUF4214 domain-containing protein, partial [Burkholderiaceae bacterium]
MASASSYGTLVQELYVAYFGRPADYFGLQNFEAALAAANAPTGIAGLEAAYSTNAAVKTLVDGFGTSAESIALYGSGTTESFVNAIFENLLNRAPSVSGLSFWVDAINSGAVSRGDAALAIAAGAQANATAQGLIDAQTIANKLAVASNFTTGLGASSLNITAYSGAAAATAARSLIAAVGSTTDTTAYQATVQSAITSLVANHVSNTYVLTAGVDTFAGGPGNDVFNAILDNTAGLAAGGQAATLNAFDSLTGGTLSNTLNITDFGVGTQMTLPAATINGMTAINVSSLEGVNVDLSGMSALTAVNVKTSSGTDNVTAGAAAALVVNDKAGAVTTTGGATVSVTTDTAHAVTVNGGSATTAVTVNGGSVATVTDANYGKSGTNTIASVAISNDTGFNKIYSNALASVSVVGSSSFQVYNGSSAAQTLALTFNGVNGGAFIDDTATTINITSTGADSSSIYLRSFDATTLNFDLEAGLGFANYGPTAGWVGPDATNVKSVTVKGGGSLYADFSNDNTTSWHEPAINTSAMIDASASTGKMTLTLATGQSFTGGTGTDMITIIGTQTGTIAAGSATNNEIVLQNIAGASSTTIASLSHFSILGVSGSTSGTFDMSKLGNGSGYTHFDVQGSNGNVTFTNVATGSTLSLEGGNSNVITLQTADSTGPNDSATVSLGTT